MTSAAGAGEYLAQSIDKFESLWKDTKGILEDESLSDDINKFEDGHTQLREMAVVLREAYFNRYIERVEDLFDRWLDFKPLLYKPLDKMANVQQLSVKDYYYERKELTEKVNLAALAGSVSMMIVLIFLGTLTIRSISRSISTVMKAAKEAGEVLTKLVQDIRKTAELVQEISSASKEQNSGAGHINNAIQELDKVIQQNAGASQEMSSTAEELALQAEKMRKAIAFFKVNEHEKCTGNNITVRRFQSADRLSDTGA